MRKPRERGTRRRIPGLCSSSTRLKEARQDFMTSALIKAIDHGCFVSI